MGTRRTYTIFSKIFIPLFCMMLVQCSIFYFVTVHGRVVSALNTNASDILTERVDNRRNEIQSQFMTQWANLAFYSDALNSMYDVYKKEYPNALYADQEQQKSFLLEASPTLVSILRNNSVNGAFLILNSSDKYQPLEGTQSLYGLGIRDYDPNSGYTDKEDLLVLRSPSSISAAVGCPLDSYWDAHYTFDSSTNTGDFYYKPIQAAYENPDVSNDNLAYFCGAHTYGSGDKQVVSYSLPLIAADGTVYGVLGVELTTSYLASLLPSEELNGQNSGAYMLVQYEQGSSEYTILAGEGTLLQRCFGSMTSFGCTVKEGEQLFEYTGKQDIKICGSVSPITIYNRNTPFEHEIFALVGAVQSDELFSVGTAVRKSLLIVTILVLFIGSIGIFVVSHLLSRPIQKLARKVRVMQPEPDAEVGLEHINIREIDQLVDAIESQSRKISQTQARTEFFSRMSHDMRTPMNAIIGFSSPEVLEHSNPEEKTEYLGKINNSGKYLLGLINEVLDMTKIDSGRMELNKEAFRTTDFWNGALPMIEELAALSEVNFVKKLPPADGCRIVADVQRLSQIVVNLLSNAVKFTPAGGTVTLTVSEKITEDGRLSYQFTVKDTGIGMSEEFQKKLYQPFEQEHTDKAGTGLGLSITHQLVTLMGGTIDCRSRQGKGTEFIVSLVFPLADAAASTAETGQAQREFSQDELRAVLSGKHILLCEDHPMNRQIACRLLENQKIKVDTAENGKRGVEIFAASKFEAYDAILMDIRMPIMDGLEATRAIRELDRGDAKTVPIIAMTANAFVEDINASSAAGMDAHLSKPVEPQKLYQTLAYFFENGIQK